MATAAKKVEIDHDAILREIGNDPILALTQPEKVDLLIAALEAEDAPADVSTKEGRSAIKKRAERADRFRLDIRAARLAKTKEWRDLTDHVNEQGKLVEPKLGALHDKIRLPLTKWEETKSARKAEAQAIIDDMVAASVITAEDTSQTVKDRLDRIRGRNLNDELFGPQLEQVVDLRDSTVATLLAAIERLEKAEADAAELARLREAEEKRLAEEAEREEAARLAREEEERQREAAAAQEQRRQEEARRIESERREAAEQAIRDAQEQARLELEERERAAQAEIDAANARELKARQEANANLAIAHIRECNLGMIGGATQPFPVIIRELEEKIDLSAETLGDHVQKVAALRDDALATIRAAMRAHEENERKAANLAHRRRINIAAKKAIMGCGVEDEALAEKIVISIAAGAIPNVSIAY
ncbi:hypothetical protein [Sphingobium sp. HDIP04]|uniref:hypothetical protein n=1 Tax=Sphingobium sp. HDIP04 TaxID=428994 RepID=UPI0003877A28|nr:hypothetical protein [Sphingobium sp. HDIP04]EQA97315.1 hypothetical protein L286_23610 [Sphingobium sp. HDIP04]